MSALSELITQFNWLVANSKIRAMLCLKIILGLWLINCFHWLNQGILSRLGNIPRSKNGIIGIGLAWIVHANFNHLFFNTIPLFILGLMLISLQPEPTFFYNISVIIILLEGIMVWIFGRKGNHIGASGLVAGYAGFFLTHAYKERSILSLSLGFIIIYYFGGILLSIFPSKPQTSWESHFFGLGSGIMAFWLNDYIKIIT